MTSSRPRRIRVVDLAVLVSTAMLVATLAPALAQKPPVKVGLLLPYTGVFALYGPEMTAAIELYLKSIGGKAGDRPIQLVREDDEGKPDVGLTKVRKLIERDRVSFVIGPVSSAVALAIRGYVDSQKVPLVVPIAFTRELTAPEKASPYIFRVIDTTDQQGYPFGQWAYRRKGFRRMAVIGSNFVAGRDATGAFKAGFEDAGGKIVTDLFPPLGTQDFVPFLARIDPAQMDAAYVVVFGADAIRLVRQWEELGLKDRIPLLGYGTTLDDNLLESMGRAAEGAISISPYSTTTDTAENREFVTVIRADRNMDPVLFHATAWVSMQLIATAVRELRGEVDDSERVIKALKAAGEGLATPMGRIRFDQYNQIIPPLYIRQTRLVEGKVRNVGIEDLPPVPQEAVWGWWRRK
jgi:branched-chain amino acid transport system substrate-binding protein